MMSRGDAVNCPAVQAEFSGGEGMSEWKEVFLEDVAAELTVGFVGSMTSEYVDSGIPFLRSKNIDPYVIKWHDIKFVSRKFHERLKKSALAPGDVVIVRTGNPGTAVLIPESLPEANCSDLVIIRPGSQLDARFLVYYLNSIAVHHINSHLVGAVQQHFNVGSARKLCMNLPPLPEQKAIAAILSSLDDKIDLLHRQNKTLEAIAETLFRQWFIEEAQPDWEEGKIEDLFVLQRGFDLPTQNRIDGNYPIYAASGFSGCHAEFKVKPPGVTTGRSGLLGRVFLVLDDFWPLNTSLYIREFRKGTPLFSYFLLRNIDLEAFNAGSAVPTLNRNHVHEFRLSIPPHDLINDFEVKMIQNFEKIKSNRTQIRTLEKLRDNLLPKLMSGEVTVEI
jgi:type I restriction enzyme, S subunit